MTDGRVNVITSHQGCSPRRNELCAMHKGHMIAHMLPPLRAGASRRLVMPYRKHLVVRQYMMLLRNTIQAVLQQPRCST